MDIVERLRSLVEEWWECCGDIHEPLAEAADEIERLRSMTKVNLEAFQNNVAEIERLREALIEAEKYNGYHQQACLEIERLRGALKDIENMPIVYESENIYKQIARSTLQQKETE